MDRRDQLLLWIGRAETARGQLSDAAFAYDTVVWEFPYRPTAAPAWLGLQAIGSTGVELPAKLPLTGSKISTDARVDAERNSIADKIVIALQFRMKISSAEK